MPLPSEPLRRNLDMPELATKPNINPRRAMGPTIARQRRLARDKIMRQRQERQERETRAAVEEIARLKERRKQVKVIEEDVNRWGVNLLRSTVSNQTALLRAWGYKQAVVTSVSDKSSQVSAWTDFMKISITWPLSQVPQRLDVTGTRDTVAAIKGVMQHEMGHLRFTTPFRQIMLNSNLERQAERNYDNLGVLHRCWNMLEDQRMESLVVDHVKRIGPYFGIMVANIILGNTNVNQSWVMLAGRSYLPLPVLKKSYELFDDFCKEQGILDGAKEWHSLVDNYCQAASEQEIADAVMAAYRFIRMVKATLPPIEHREQDNGTNDIDPANTSRQRSNILDMFEEGPKGEKGEGEKGEPGGSGEGEEDFSGEGTTPGQSDKGGNSADGSGTPKEQDLADELKSMTESWTQEVRQDPDVKEAVREARDHTSNNEGSGLPDYPNIPNDMSDSRIASAQSTAKGIEDALNTFLTEASPMWQQRVEVGVINPVHYRTKGVGDRNYRRMWDDKGTSGLNVHVSMLCDISGSMSGDPMLALSESVYATALACQSIGIGTSFTLWSTIGGNYRIYRNGITPSLWSAQGGTDPLIALDDLDTHNPEGAERHLVIIFTDGAWSGSFPSLKTWDAPNRNIVLVRYGAYDGAVQKDMGAHRHIAINNVGDLPKQLTHALTDILDRKE